MALERVPFGYSQGRRRGAYDQPQPDRRRSRPQSPSPLWPSAASATSSKRRFCSSFRGVDFIDESEVLTPADEQFHIDKHPFQSSVRVRLSRPRRSAAPCIGEGAAMIRTKGEAGSGNIVEAERHLRTVHGEIRRLQGLPKEELMTAAKNLGAPYDLVREVAATGKLPVPNFSAGGVATPADAALMMQLGAESVFVGSGIFKSDDPAVRARAIVGIPPPIFNNPSKLVEALNESRHPNGRSRRPPNARRRKAIEPWLVS